MVTIPVPPNIPVSALYDPDGRLRSEALKAGRRITQGCTKARIKRKLDYRQQAPEKNILISKPIAALAERASAERSSKGQLIIVTDDVQRVVGALALLARNGDIDQAQSSAAERWYRDYVMGVIGARDPEARRSGKAPDPHASMLARAAAVARCRSVRDGLGLCGEIRLKLLLIDELSFSSIASRLFPGDVNGRKKVAAQMVFLLEQLAELYLALDRRRSDVSRLSRLT